MRKASCCWRTQQVRRGNGAGVPRPDVHVLLAAQTCREIDSGIVVYAGLPIHRADRPR